MYIGTHPFSDDVVNSACQVYLVSRSIIWRRRCRSVSVGAHLFEKRVLMNEALPFGKLGPGGMRVRTPGPAYPSAELVTAWLKANPDSRFEPVALRVWQERSRPMLADLAVGGRIVREAVGVHRLWSIQEILAQ